VTAKAVIIINPIFFMVITLSLNSFMLWCN
jgi:hypothetical protein